jgi:hypothetical protein
MEDEDIPLEILERRVRRTMRQMLSNPQPGDRWPYEPPAPGDGPGDEAGDREPRIPHTPNGSAAMALEPDED